MTKQKTMDERIADAEAHLAKLKADRAERIAKETAKRDAGVSRIAFETSIEALVRSAQQRQMPLSEPVGNLLAALFEEREQRRLAEDRRRRAERKARRDAAEAQQRG